MQLKSYNFTSMQDLQELFLLDKDITFLNFGSFGACPKPVFEQYQAYQLELEKQPVSFIVEKAPMYLKQSREALAAYINCKSDDLVYVTNPSYAVNIVAKSFALKAGDEVLTTSLEYGACDRTWQLVCEQAGATYKQQAIALPIVDEAQIVDQLFAGVTDRTKLIFVSHITSSTALILPVDKIIARAKQLQIPVFVDGAHAPGHIDLDLTELDADYYCGACHKWMMTPKGSSFLHAKTALHESLDPLVVSWGYKDFPSTGSKLVDYHELQGTRDVSAMLCIPAALHFMKQHEWPMVSQKCQQLVYQYAPIIANILGSEALAPINNSFIGQMISLPIATTDPMGLKKHLLNKYSIEIPIMQLGQRTFIRYSFNGFNTEADLQKLQKALEEIVADGNLAKLYAS
jgi:isopenicillin-N epimerase